MNATESHDPMAHVISQKQRMNDLINHLVADVNKIQDPSAKVLFEVSAEVIRGLRKALDDYEHRNEPAWRID